MSISNKQLSENISRLVNVFGSNPFSSERIRRIGSILENIPEKAVVSIVDTMIDTMKTAPTPNDFAIAASSWKRANQVYDESKASEFQLGCFDCYDTGFMFCKVNESEPTTLIFCHCNEGKIQNDLKPDAFIPMWQKDLGPVFGFIKIKFPFESFKPKSTNVISSGNFSSEILSIVQRWENKKKEAEAYWRTKRNESKKEIA